MTAWLVILTIGLGSYALRASMLVALASHPISDRHHAALGLVGPAAVGALVATMTFTSAGELSPRSAAQLAAIAVGFLAVRRSGNVVHAFAAGLPTLWILTAASALVG